MSWTMNAVTVEFGKYLASSSNINSIAWAPTVRFSNGTLSVAFASMTLTILPSNTTDTFPLTSSGNVVLT